MSQSAVLLHEAIWKNDEHTITNYLKTEQDLNLKDENGLRPLDIAVMTSNDKIVKLLLADKTKKVKIDSKIWSHLPSIDNEKIVSYLVEHYDGASIGNCKDDNGQTPLHHTVINRNPRFIVLFCALGCKINDRTTNGFTALHFAAIGGDVKSMEILLTQGAVSNMKTVSGKTPLYFAVKHGHIESVRLLINQGGTVNDIVDSFGSSPMHIAVENNDQSMVQLLAQLNVDIMCKTSNDKNLLHVAAEYGHENLIKFFISKGIDINSVTSDNVTPLLMAMKNGRQNAAIILLNYKPNVNIIDKSGLSPLCLALQENDIELSKKLVSLGANVNNLTLENSSVLHFAVKYCNVNMVKYLQQCGAKLGTRDHLGQKELHIAAKFNNSDMVLYILQLGVDVNEVTLDRSTALHYAVESASTDTVKLLLKYGALVNAENESGDAALNIICSKRRHDITIVEDLLKNHADPNHIGSDTQTPMRSCIMNENISTTTHLAKHGASCDKVNSLGDSVIQLLIKKPYGCSCKRSRFIKEFVTLGANINNVNSDGETALHTSLTHEKYEGLQEVQTLINLGALITSNKFGETILHIILKNNNRAELNLIEFFLEKDLPLHDVTTNGHTIIHYAVQYNKNLEILKILLEKTQKRLINKKDKAGITPLHIAAGAGENDLVKILLEHNAYVDCKDNNNDSPINYAINGEHIETVKILLNSRALITDKNKDGLNAYDLAERKNRHIYQLLLTHSSYVN